MITEKQKRERHTGIGGSDAQHLFSEPPYGCERKMWYEKTQHEADHPMVESGAMTRGNKLEDLTADEYKEATGRRIVRRIKTIRHKQYPYMMAHVDRLIQKDPRGVGILECKTVGREIYFQIMRDGLPLSNALQLQWCMAVTGYTWGAFAILWAEDWKFIHFEVQRDEKLIKHLTDAAHKFWRRVENGPPPERLDPKDKRCKKCPFRTTCQGEALLASVQTENGEIQTDYSLDGMVAEFIRYKDIVEEATVLMDGAKERLKEAIGDRPVVDTHGYRLHFKPYESSRFDTRRFRKEHPATAKKYTTVSVYRPLKTIAK